MLVLQGTPAQPSKMVFNFVNIDQELARTTTDALKRIEHPAEVIQPTEVQPTGRRNQNWFNGLLLASCPEFFAAFAN